MRMEQRERANGLRRLVCTVLALALLWSIIPASAEVTHGVVTGDKVLFRKEITGSDYWDRLDKGWVAKVLDEVKDSKYTWYKVETNVPVALSRTYVGYIRGDFFRMLTQAEETAWLVNKPQPYLAAIDGGTAPTASPAPTDTDKVTASPAPTNPPLTGDYGLVAVAGANLRETPGGTSLTALQKDQLVKVLGFPTAGNPWHKVQVLGTGNSGATQVEGYLQTDHLRVLTQDELDKIQATAAPITSTPVGATATPVPSDQDATGTLRITKTSTNLRKEPGGKSLWQYAIGTELPYFGAPVFSGGYYWAKVSDSRRHLEGYVRSDCYEITTGEVITPPAPSAPPDTGTPTGNSVRITLGGTNLRQAPGGSVVAVLARGRVLPFFGSPTAQGGYNWVYVYDYESKLYGYVRSDCYEFVSGAPVVTPAPTASPAPGAPAVGTLTLIKGGVNLRNAPAGKTIAQLERGLVLSYTAHVQEAGYTWYLVQSPKGVGYVRSDVIRLTTPTETDGPVVTEPVNTPPPAAGAFGYIITTKSAINLRQKANPHAPVVGSVDKAQVLPLTGAIQSANGYNWYPVNISDTAGFLRSDCVRQLSNAEVADYLNHNKQPSITPPGGSTGEVETGYVLTTTTSVNVRATASLDARTLGQIPAEGTAFPLLGTITAGGRLWYKITYQGQQGYLLGSVARMMSQAEYLAYLAGLPSPSPTPAPTPVPPPESLSQTAITNIKNVIIRSGAGSHNRNLATVYKVNSVVKLTGASVALGTETWYPVRVSGINGWIRGDLLRVLTKEEEKLLETVGDPDAPKPATYRTLQWGSTGEDVTRLQQELNRQGYLQAAFITGVYNNETVEAVKSYQKANGLVVDGAAGSNTQHKLFNTVPEDTYNPGGGSTVTPSLNPVEIVDWYTGDINTFWGRGEVATITDVNTGISFRVKRWAGGYHVDGEPLTKADTAALTRIYGVKSAQEILEKNLYQRRPLWVTLKGRTFAASLYGVPHNYPQGDTIPDNDYNGQLCVHFYNSRIHSSGSVDSGHMSAIQKAYDAAPSKK